MGVRTHILVLLAAFAIAAGFPAPVRAEAPLEYQVKAAFIFNFVRFTDWPPDAFNSDNEPIIVAVVGVDPFAGALEQAVAGKKVGQREIVIRRFPNETDIARCHVLFVSTSEREHLASIIRRLGDSSILTVGETDDFTRHGGMIRFYTEEKKLRFEIRVDAAERARLKLSAQLLRLAKIYGK